MFSLRRHRYSISFLSQYVNFSDTAILIFWKIILLYKFLYYLIKQKCVCVTKLTPDGPN